MASTQDLPESSEKDIENNILSYLKMKRIFAWKNQSVGIYDQAQKRYRKSNSKHHINGVSDILGIHNGKLLAIEVKSKKGRPSENQIDFIKRIYLQGGLTGIARSIEDVEIILSGKEPDCIK